MKKLFLSLAAIAAAALFSGAADAPNINAQTGSTYTFLNTDCSKLVTLTNAAQVAATLPQPSSASGGGAGAGTFMPPCAITVQNTGSQAAVITATSSTIDGAGSLTIPTQGTVTLTSDGANWHKSVYGITPATIGANLLHNGDFQIDQRNAGGSQTIATGTPAMTVDRWYATFTTSTSSAGNPTTQQVSLASGLTIASKELKFTANATPSTTVPAGLISTIQQSIEGADVGDLQWGTAQALPVTVSFWIKTSVAGTWGVGLQNGGAARSYVFNCATGAATWTFCSATVPGDVTGTWNSTPNSIGPVLIFTQSCGSTFQAAAANAWSAGAFSCTSAQTQLTASASATMEIAAVKMERGSAATAFVPDSFAVAMAKAQRFYRTDFAVGTAPAQNIGTGKGETCISNPIANGEPGIWVPFTPPIYHVASPTVTTYNPAATNANFRNETASSDVTIGSTSVYDSGLLLPTGATTTTIAQVLCVHFAVDTKL